MVIGALRVKYLSCLMFLPFFFTFFFTSIFLYSKPVLSGHSKRTQKIVFQYGLLLNAGQKYCRMLQGEHTAILSTFIKLAFVIKTFVLSIYKWPLKTGFSVIIRIFTLIFIIISSLYFICTV